MVRLLLAAISLMLALAGMVARKTYYLLPPHELKRRAAKGDVAARQLYRIVAYGSSARTILWGYIGLTSALSIVLLAKVLPIWISLLIVGPLLWLVFSLLPATRLSRLSTKITLFVTPAIAWVLNYLYPLVSRLAERIEYRYVAATHTRLFERDDLLDLIARQRTQKDSRFSVEELAIAERALTFDQHVVRDVLTPKTDTHVVLADDVVGPVLIDELVKAGQPYVLVCEAKKGPFVGVLATAKLGISSSGIVRTIMESPVYYLHEDDSLSEALHAFFTTNFPLFVVVNNFEEIVGTVSVENMCNQLLGHIPGDDFDQYADRSAVARRHAAVATDDSSDEK